ncbi:hypothetical protein RDI58_029413 [Solanum bulbocastanum]|uniref:Uncharacterized protein n=1 Tax=Solanum bulbocastanum TaxID=147425 RepID=A0AAN8XZX2_SOLBU
MDIPQLDSTSSTTSLVESRFQLINTE